MPTVLDRVIAPAIRQGLGPSFDPDVAVHSDGFRPGRSAPQALERAWREIADGDRGVVQLDLETCFDRVHHDRGRSRVARTVTDKRLLKVIRRDLNAWIMQDGGVSQREAGRPQGSPLSPRWSNIL
jgi:RNA-directed DNA polymerase